MNESGPDDDARRALLELLLAEEGIDPAGPGDEIVPSDGPPLLSFAQERLWFLHQLNDDSALNVRGALRLHGPLDVPALEAAVGDVVARHVTLRTAYAVVDGRPRPVAVEAAGVWSIDDLEADEDPEARVREILSLEGAARFDLERTAPIRVRLIRVAPQEHVLSVVVHHIAADGWSMRVLVRDLAAFYGERTGRGTSDLAELAVDYHDYAAWQREHASGARHAEQLEFWRATLAGPLPDAELPPDFARARRHTFEGRQVGQVIAGPAADGLRAVAREASATTFMVLLAVLDILIARRTDLDDVIVGTPVAGRVRPEAEPMVGAFLNMLALRVDLSGDPSFLELLGRARDVALDAYDHQDVAFEEVLAELAPERDASRTPFFQVLLNMVTADDGSVGGVFAGVETEVVPQGDLASNFDLTVYVDEQPDGPISLLFVYNRALYRDETMRQLLEQFVAVLDSAIADPHRRISDLSLVTAEAERVLPSPAEPLDDSWRGTVVDALRRQASVAPDRVAIEASTGARLSYGELAARTELVAAWLMAQGIGVGRLVAVHGHRSPELVWTILGILACGASYVILDPSYPPARRARQLRIASPTAWLTVPGAGSTPPEVSEALDDLAVAVRADVGDLEMSEPRQVVEPVDIGPGDVACVTFTSGSTGEPKGVVGRHGSLTHFLPWQTEAFGVTPEDRFTMLSGLAHDPLQRDMFWPIWVGATLVVPDPAQIPTPGWVADWMARSGVTIAHLTPAMGRLVSEHAGETVVPTLRHAFYIGDALTGRDVQRLTEVAPNVSVCNLYGTTETQRASAFHVVGSDDVLSGDGTVPLPVLPIGRGLPGGAQVLVRTTSGAPAGFGEVGEIWMRSPHLAEGYLDDPELTAERFVALGSGPDRAYRTGDRGRYRFDGVIEYRGRQDGQVQIRGFRVETAEVRAAMTNLHDVADGAVVVTGGDRPRLVGYLVPRDHLHPPDPAAVRARLRAVLPSHMVPSDLVVIDHVPLTPSGKLDAGALPAPPAPTVEVEHEPRDELEQRLAGWFAAVLELDRVGIHDNFFDLGGYSLLATQLFATIEAETGHRIPVATLFEAPTVATLAEVLRRGVDPSSFTSVVAIQPRGTEPPFFYVAPYMIGVVELARLGDELGDDQPLFGIQPQGLDGRSPVHTSIEEMAAHYIDEIKAIQPLGPYRIGGHCSGSWVAFEMARQLEASGDELESVVLVDQGPPGVERELPPAWKYAAMRLRFYFRDRRLLSAIRWQLKIRAKRRFLRRVAPRTIRIEEQVREAHRSAYRAYEGGRWNTGSS